MGERHGVFISYHDGRRQPGGGDYAYKEEFERLFHHHAQAIISRAVQPGDIDDTLPAQTIRQKIRDEYLRDSSVTVVLVGARTWQRKHVDWEIGSSIRDTELNPRSGLLGILLPSYPDLHDDRYTIYTIPPRLWDNVECGYATMHHWTTDPTLLQSWIHEAFLRRKTHQPNNGRTPFAQNRTGPRWHD